jgi:hypothetical protein
VEVIQSESKLRKEVILFDLFRQKLRRNKKLGVHLKSYKEGRRDSQNSEEEKEP